MLVNTTNSAGPFGTNSYGKNHNQYSYAINFVDFLGAEKDVENWAEHREFPESHSFDPTRNQKLFQKVGKLW